MTSYKRHPEAPVTTTACVQGRMYFLPPEAQVSFPRCSKRSLLGAMSKPAHDVGDAKQTPLVSLGMGSGVETAASNPLDQNSG